MPALNLQEEPRLAQRLLELAAEARGERLPGTFSVTRQVEVVVKDEIIDNLHLPALPVRVIGREQEVSAICNRLMETPGRLFTLVGSPGVGKTTLAIAAAARVQSFFPAGVYFVSLATLLDPAQLAATLSSALELPESSAKPPHDRLIEHLRRKALLLVLDNFEQLLTANLPAQPTGDHKKSEHKQPAVGGARLIADLLVECPQLRVLITSREPLRLRAEQRHLINPLALADATALFVERAQAVEPSFALTSRNVPTVEAICQQLDCLPLALELIAARADLLTPRQMLDRLSQQPLHLLASDLHDLPDRHRTLYNALEHSYGLLSEDEQQSFRALGVFVGGFDLAAAEALGIEAATVDALVKKSLLRREKNTTQSESPFNSERVTLLETLRHFALEQLVRRQEEQERRVAHCHYFADLAQLVFNGVRSEQQAAWLQRTHRDHDNLRAALRFALDQGDGIQAVAIAGGLWWFWYRQGFINEGRGWLAASLGCAVREDQVEQFSLEELAQAKRRRARACNGAGSMASEQGDYTSALAYFEEGVAIFTELDDPLGISMMRHNMGLLASGQGNYPQALRWLEEALALERQHNPTNPETALMTANIGITAYEMGDVPLAQRWLAEGWQLAQHESDVWVQAFVAFGLAEVLRVTDDLKRANELAHESLRRFEQLNDRHYLPEPLIILAKLALAQGDLVAARTYALSVLQQYQELKDDHGVANILPVLARLVLAETGDVAGAIRAARLLGVSIHLRAQNKRRLSIPEQNERAESLAILARYLAQVERDQLIDTAHTIDWQGLIVYTSA